MARNRIDFSNLSNQSYKINSTADFDTVCNWMDNRFIGLPLFHQSITIKVKQFDKIIENESDSIKIPKSVFKITNSHLQKDLKHLISYIQREEGYKSFSLLHLTIKLPRHLLNKEFKNHKRINLNPIFSACKYLGPFIEIPVVLAVASRKSYSYYKSLAVGISGVTRYHSVLNMSFFKDKSEYIIQGNLEAKTSVKHIISPFKKLILKSNVLPENFFNLYIDNHLNPEREKIIEKLCKYVFQEDLSITNIIPIKV